MQKFPGNDPIWKSRRVLTNIGEFVHSDLSTAKGAPPRTEVMPFVGGGHREVRLS